MGRKVWHCGAGRWIGGLDFASKPWQRGLHNLNSAIWQLLTDWLCSSHKHDTGTANDGKIAWQHISRAGTLLRVRNSWLKNRRLSGVCRNIFWDVFWNKKVAKITSAEKYPKFSSKVSGTTMMLYSALKIIDDQPTSKESEKRDAKEPEN